MPVVLLRKLALIALGCLIMAVVLTKVSSPHALPAPIHKPWSQWTLKQQERYVRANLRHARFAKAFVRQNRRLYSERTAERLIGQHHRLEMKARRNLREINHMLYLRSLWPWCRRGECVATLIRRLWPEDPEGAVTVARCESGLIAMDYVDGLSVTGQYVGVFQLGTSERAQYGHVGSGRYSSADASTALSAPAWEQITAAHNLFRAYRGWGPWQCLPTGGLRW
jgi:hypothetical protein